MTAWYSGPSLVSIRLSTTCWQTPGLAESKRQCGLHVSGYQAIWDGGLNASLKACVMLHLSLFNVHSFALHMQKPIRAWQWQMLQPLLCKALLIGGFTSSMVEKLVCSQCKQVACLDIR